MNAFIAHSPRSAVMDIPVEIKEHLDKIDSLDFDIFEFKSAAEN